MKKPIMKALAAGLAITLALSTPVTAFAGSIADIFATEEGGTKTATETDTNTGTHTNTKSGVVEIKPDVEYNVVGVAFDKEVIKPIVGGEAVELTAVILIDNSEDTAKGTESIRVQELADYESLTLNFEGQEVKATDLYENLTFYEDAAVSAEKGVAQYENKEFVTHTQLEIPYLRDAEGQLVLGDNKVPTVNGDTIKVTGTKAGNTYVSVRLGATYKASTLVQVKDYDANIKLGAVPNNYQKHTVDMNEFLENEGNLDITWRAYTVDNKGNQKVYKTINSDGKLTLSAVTKDKSGNSKTGDGKLHVTAVAENGKVAHAAFEVTPGNPIKKFLNATKITTKQEIKDNNGVTVNLSAEFDITKNESNINGTTDNVTWSVDKKFVETVTFEKTVEKAADINQAKKISNKVTIKAPGTVKITATSTSGKKVTFTVKVTAPLQKIDEITGVNSLYPGQSVDLSAVTIPGVTDTKLSWAVYEKEDVDSTTGAPKNKKSTKFATVKAAKDTTKATLTAKAIAEKKTVYVQASGKVKEGKNTVTKYSPMYAVEIKESPITGTNNDIARTYDNKNLPLIKNKKAITLNVSKSYDLQAAPKVDDESISVDDMQSMVVWSSNKTKVATVDKNGTITPVAAGKATITVKAVGYTKDSKGNRKVKTFTDKVDVTIKTPVKSIVLKQDNFTVNPTTKNKDQKVTLKVNQYLPKNCTKEIVDWEIISYTTNDKPSLETNNTNVSKSSSAKVVVPSTAKLGDVIVVQATAASGAKTKATITVCNATSKVAYKSVKSADMTIGDKDGDKIKTIDLADYLTVTAKDSKADASYNEKIVSYTVNKKGIVNIVGSKVYAVNTGKVTVTAKTASGKKATFTINVKPATFENK